MKIKQSFLLLVSIFIFSQAIDAQVMGNQKAVWVTIKSNNLKCYECKNLLLNFLTKEVKANYESGILESRFNLIQGEAKFKYIPDRITPEDIRIIFNQVGFDADEEKAEEEQYKKLPPNCKRAADGGGPKKGSPCHIEPTY